MTEWDNTAWAGTNAGIIVPKPRKAVTGPGVASYQNGYLLSSMRDTPQARAATFLQAYKCGWFYKAGSKITGDFAALPWSLSSGDADANETETALPRPDLTVPWEQLSAIDQLQRLMEKPNPYQTGRQLRQKTLIRRDFGGAAFWYLENGAFGLPTAIYGISPARMWVSRAPNGQVIGYVMDRDRPGGGVPFEASEIVAFPGVGPDDGDGDIFGVSVVEAVYAELPLTELMARHTGDLLTTGGRLAGMMWPKERALDENEFADAQKAWRNVASDSNAARRLLIFPEPMEWAAGASTPAEIGIPELAALNRDNILTAFPIDPTMLGVPMPSGLNASGETRVELRRSYWGETIHPRVVAYDEVINVGLVSRYEALLGETYVYETEEPDLDDAATLAEKVKAYNDLVSAGFDDKEARDAVGLDHIKFNAVPALKDPATQAAMAEMAANAPRVAPPKPFPSKAARAVEDRDKVTQPIVAHGKNTLETFFAEQRARVVESLTKELGKASKAKRMEAIKADPPVWWDSAYEDDRLSKTMRGIYLEVGRGSLQSVADTLNRIIAGKQVDPIVADLLSYGGERIRDINARTLQSLVTELAEGTRRGYSLQQLIDGVPDEGFKGVSGMTLDNGTPVFGDLRAETIARTETMLSYNRATVTGYESFGVTHLLAYDGDEDELCANRDGQEFTIDEAAAEEEHPNGTLVWSPVVDKAYKPAEPDPVLVAVLEALKGQSNQPIHANVTAPAAMFEVNGEGVELSQKTVYQPPEIHMPALDLGPLVDVLTPLVTAQKATQRLLEQMAKPKVLKRDAEGRIVGLE